MERKPLVVGNWKMALSHKSELELVRALKHSMKNVTVPGQVVICPSYTALPLVAEELRRSKKIELGAQNVFWEDKGAYTGQVSINQIKPLVSWCIVGHSEVRALVDISEAQVVESVKKILAAGLSPIVCIGETVQERAADMVVEKIRSQVEVLLGQLDRTSLVKTVIAYEPIWAIGTGELPSPDEVAQVILLVRKQIAERHGQELAERVRILYGGSVKADFCDQYVGGPLADGVLVGGASVHPQEFASIITKVNKALA